MTRTRADDTTRLSRDQESRDAMDAHDDDLVSFEPTGPLPNIDARPGFAQRWIRTRKGNDADAHNLFAAARRGWAPRSPSSVPRTLQWLTVQREGLGGCIGTHDMVLMERPNELNAREADVKRRERRERERAVKNNLFSEYKGIGGARSGMTAPDVESSSRIERGRAPAIQDD